jgi:putative endonuclease
VSKEARIRANVRGRIAEAAAARYLEGCGLRILDRGFTAPRGEIDIIARDGDDLVFVEVRARASSAAVGAIESVTRDKRRKIARAATWYVVRGGLEDVPARFDIVEVTMAPDGAIEDTTWQREAFTLDDC